MAVLLHATPELRFVLRMAPVDNYPGMVQERRILQQRQRTIV